MELWGRRWTIEAHCHVIVRKKLNARDMPEEIVEGIDQNRNKFAEILLFGRMTEINKKDDKGEKIKVYCRYNLRFLMGSKKIFSIGGLSKLEAGAWKSGFGISRYYSTDSTDWLSTHKAEIANAFSMEYKLGTQNQLKKGLEKIKELYGIDGKITVEKGSNQKSAFLVYKDKSKIEQLDENGKMITEPSEILFRHEIREKTGYFTVGTEELARVEIKKPWLVEHKAAAVKLFKKQYKKELKVVGNHLKKGLCVTNQEYDLRGTITVHRDKHNQKSATLVFKEYSVIGDLDREGKMITEPPKITFRHTIRDKRGTLTLELGNINDELTHVNTC